MPSDRHQEISGLQKRPAEGAGDAYAGLSNARKVDPAALHVDDSNIFDSLGLVRARHQDSVANWPLRIDEFDHRSNGKPVGVCKRVAEHVEEGGLGEGVEPREGGAALGPQRVRLVQDLRNPLLLAERR